MKETPIRAKATNKARVIRLFMRRLTERPYESVEEQSRVMRYLKSALPEQEPDENRCNLLAQLLGTYGANAGALDRFDVLEQGDFERVKGIITEFEKLYSSEREDKKDLHDTLLEAYGEHSDTVGWSHQIPVDTAELDRQTVAPCEEKLSDDSDVVTPPIRFEDFEGVLASVAAIETESGKQIIQSIRRLFGMPPEVQSTMFLKNDRFNQSEFRRSMGPTAPDDHTIKRVIRKIQSEVEKTPRPVRRATDPQGEPKPCLTLGASMEPEKKPTSDRSPAGPTSIPEAMLSGLQNLIEVYRERLRYPHDDTLRFRLGYLCTIAGRQAATEVYRLTNQIDSITPGLPRAANHGEVVSSLLNFLRQVMSGEILRDPDDPLLRLVATLKTGGNLFTIGESAIRSAVALLGLNEYGGVLAAWQLQALAFNLMSWEDHIAFNERVREYAGQLYPEAACKAARKYELPSPDYLAAGCLGNIVNAGYRNAILHPGDARGQAARATADRALEKLEKDSSPELKKMMLLGGLQVARAACAAILGDAEAARRHWDLVTRPELPSILDDYARTEPCVPVRQLVVKTAKAAFGL